MFERLRKPLTPQTARQIVGEWMTYRRSHRRRKGEVTPPAVTAAYRFFTKDRDRALTQRDRERIASHMRKVRVSKGYTSVIDRLSEFDRSLIPRGGRIVSKVVTTNREFKNRWMLVYLELPAAVPGYVLRYKATAGGYYHALQRTTRGRRKPGQPQPFAWTTLPVHAIASLHPAAQAFLAAVRPLPS